MYSVHIEFFLVKYDYSGNAIWSVTTNGSPLDDLPKSVAVDALQNIYIAGGFDSPSLIFGFDNLNATGGGGYDMFLAKYNKSLGLTNTTKEEQTVFLHPNPVTQSNALTISFISGEYNYLNIYNSLQVEVYHTIVLPIEANKQISVENLLSGYYFLQLSGITHFFTATFVANH